MMQLELNNITKSFGTTHLFRSFSLSFKSGNITCLTGPSGCGKTTLLNIIAGTVKPDSGSIAPDTDGAISFLFQESRLLPWLTAIENAIYLIDDSVPAGGKKEQGMELFHRAGLEGYENHYPGQLSGGMKRRVALVRTLLHPGPVVLMDEPFVSLDEKLRFEIAEMISNYLHVHSKTAVCVTHDLITAGRFGDTVLSLGRTNGSTVIV